jgi:hypothetical protein
VGCLVGVHPANAAPLLDDTTAGTPQRFVWLPADDPDVPDERPAEPPALRHTLWTPTSVLDVDPKALRPMSVCQTAIEEIERARLDRLRGIPSDALDGHSLL